MLEKINNGDLIITPNNIKNQILKELTNSKQLLNIKFMTLKEFTNNYFENYKPESLYFLMEKYNLNYGVAKEYLNNIFHKTNLLTQYYDDLKQNNLIEINPLFKHTLNNIKVIGYNLIDPYIKEALNKYNTSYIDIPKNKYIPKIYEFDKQSEEIAFIASDITQKLKTININDIYLINVTEDYKEEIKRIFKLFNIPINLETSKNIYSTETTNIFLKKLKQTKDLTKALNKTPQNDIYNKIVDTLNDLKLPKINNTAISIIENKLKETTIKINKLKNAINITDLNATEEGKHYYLLGFNQGIIPKIYKDEKLLKDKERTKLGLLTSFQKYKQNKETTIELIHSIKNLTITYKLKDNYNTYFPSPLVEELNLKPIINPEIKLNYSNEYNKHLLTSYLDKYLKFGEINPNLKILLNTYNNIPYQTYQNNFTGINLNDLYTHLNNKLNLSYSSMNNYYNCAFKFYIQNILNLGPFEENFAATIGNLFHHTLSKMYEDNFNLKETYDEYLKELTLTPKQKFFTKKLYQDLEFVINTIKKQETHSKYNKVLTENYIEIDKSHNLQIKFLGYIDKIKYTEDEKVLAAIIDYKTGTPNTTLDNINYGLNLQLPVYIYLTKNGMHQNIKITGFYLQKILNAKEVDSSKNEEDKLKLDGYTINEEDIIQKFDDTYEKSEVIKSMSITSKGFSSYAKLISEDNIKTINHITEEKINEAIQNIESANFQINPKRIDTKLVGCEYCKFKDLCFRKEEDIINLKNTKLKEILEGGKINA